MHPMYYEYYDKLQQHKDYGAEVDVILRIFSDAIGRLPRRVFDIGCGTGNHAFKFAARVAQVVGMDIDPKIIEVARGKCGAVRHGPMFVDTMADVGGTFDLVVSLFNVVNYVETRAGLLEFFRNARSFLHHGGFFIFDCWNGIAAIRDLPKKKVKRIADLEVEVEPDINLMRQMVVVHNRVHGPDCNFDFSYAHRLWTPRDLVEALIHTGFEFVKVVDWMRPAVLADSDSWKIMFVCRRRFPHGD